MAVYVVSSLLRPDGTVQTTSQVTLDQFPNFINGNEVQLFVQTHGLVHLRNVQAHSSSRSIRAMQPGHQFPAVPELGLRLARMDTQKMKMTGVNGPRPAFELMMIGGDLDRHPFRQYARWRPPRWT